MSRKAAGRKLHMRSVVQFHASSVSLPHLTPARLGLGSAACFKRKALPMILWAHEMGTALIKSCITGLTSCVMFLHQLCGLVGSLCAAMP